jgi:hypothetical protein
MNERAMTFAQRDALAAEREEKERELIDRLTALYVKNFNFSELTSMHGYSFGQILNEAHEAARGQLEGWR